MREVMRINRSFEVIVKIEVVPYDPVWALLFEKEKQLLLKALPSSILEVHHIGSTSVDGLAAKPIVDILLAVTNLKRVDESSYVFEKYGYEVMGEFGIEGRRYFRKSPRKRTHHIHAFMKNDSNILRHLAFRDYLRTHSEIKIEYAELKTVLAATCNNDIDTYSAGKNDFIKYHEREALKLVEHAHNNRLHEDTSPVGSTAE